MTEEELRKLIAANPDLTALHDGAPVGGALAPTVGHTERRYSEYDLQSDVITECDRRALRSPRWGLIMAIPNGQYRAGQRMEPGLRSGVPDLFLPIPRRGYHGLWIELKIRPHKRTERQAWWAGELAREGYRVDLVFDSAALAINVIEQYLEGDGE